MGDVLTTLLCMFLALSSVGCVVVFLKVVAAAAMDSPALERSVRLKPEANSLTVYVDIFL